MRCRLFESRKKFKTLSRRKCMLVKLAHSGTRPGTLGSQFFSSMFPMFSSLEETFGMSLDAVNNFAVSGDSIPKLNVYVERQDEENLKFVVEASIAGVYKEDVKITLKGNTLTLIHDPKDSKEPERVYVVRELSARSFKRNILIPELVNLDSLKTSFVNGVVRIEFDVYENDPKARNVEF
jgi:HSP20 family molecular chaperone IbpA